jgi:RNase P subunit RPR2
MHLGLSTHHLTVRERRQLKRVYQLLQAITDMHCHTCECPLCEARSMSCTEEEAAFHVVYVPCEDGRN